MLTFENGVIIEATFTTPANRLLSFQQLIGMITEGQWIELIREIVRDNEDVMYDILYRGVAEEMYDWISCIKEFVPNSFNDDGVTPKYDLSTLSVILANTRFVDEYWEKIGELLYNLENCQLKGSIIYMMTFADGDVAIRCRGF